MYAIRPGDNSPLDIPTSLPVFIRLAIAGAYRRNRRSPRQVSTCACFIILPLMRKIRALAKLISTTRNAA